MHMIHLTNLEPVDFLIGIVIGLICLAWAADVVFRWWENED